jgi:hypothetical protein
LLIGDAWWGVDHQSTGLFDIKFNQRCLSENGRQVTAIFYEGSHPLKTEAVIEFALCERLVLADTVLTAFYTLSDSFTPKPDF